MWAVLFSDGAVSLDDVEQIQRERWIPVAAIKRKDAPDSPGTVLLFHGRDTAYKFMRRNMSQMQWLKGGIELTDVDIENVKARFTVEELGFPKRFDSHPEFELTYEVIELCDSPDVQYVRVKV